MEFRLICLNHGIPYEFFLGKEQKFTTETFLVSQLRRLKPKSMPDSLFSPFDPAISLTKSKTIFRFCYPWIFWPKMSLVILQTYWTSRNVLLLFRLKTASNSTQYFGKLKQNFKKFLPSWTFWSFQRTCIGASWVSYTLQTFFWVEMLCLTSQKHFKWSKILN